MRYNYIYQKFSYHEQPKNMVDALISAVKFNFHIIISCVPGFHVNKISVQCKPTTIVMTLFLSNKFYYWSKSIFILFRLGRKDGFQPM